MLKKISCYLLKYFFVSCLLVFIVNCHGFKNDEIVLPIKSDQFVSYYTSTGSYQFDFNLSEQYQTRTKRFNSQEIAIPVKGEHFSSRYVNDEINYYEIGHFILDGYTYKLIIYHRNDGEADTPILNFQLNSYDAQNNLIDALLLDSRFHYEDIARFSDFEITQGYFINIISYITYFYKENKYGEIDKEIENPKPQVYKKEQYKIENGYFLEISQ